MKFYNKVLLTVCIASVFLIGGNALYIDATDNVCWGRSVRDPKAKKLYENLQLQRLKYIDQSGPAHYFCGGVLPKYTRYEHSVGVLALLKKFNCSYKEQVAGLFHDVSHTVFSHVADYMDKDKNKYIETGVQDVVHQDFLERYDVVRDSGLSKEDLDPDNPEYKGLEQKLPDLCADRIEYILHTGVLLKLITEKEAREIVNDLRYENGRWYFAREERAKKFGDISLYCTQNFWGSLWNTRANIHLAEALNRLIEIGELDVRALRAYDDAMVLEILENSFDSYVRLCLRHCEEPLLSLSEERYSAQHIKPKFRGVDPWVKDEDGSFYRLTWKNLIYENAFKETKRWCEVGFFVKILFRAISDADKLNSSAANICCPKKVNLPPSVTNNSAEGASRVDKVTKEGVADFLCGIVKKVLF